MDYSVDDNHEKRAIREIKNDLLWEAAKRARRTVLTRLYKKEEIAPEEKKAAALALDTLAQIFE